MFANWNNSKIWKNEYNFLLQSQFHSYVLHITIFKIHNHIFPPCPWIVQSSGWCLLGKWCSNSIFIFVLIVWRFHSSIPALQNCLSHVGQSVPMVGGINAGCCSTLHWHFYYDVVWMITFNSFVIKVFGNKG